jgi:hypothetical protein
VSARKGMIGSRGIKKAGLKEINEKRTEGKKK